MNIMMHMFLDTFFKKLYGQMLHKCVTGGTSKQDNNTTLSVSVHAIINTEVKSSKTFVYKALFMLILLCKN